MAFLGNYTLAELAKSAGKKERTVRYYQSLGLLRQPGQIGAGAHYNDDDRLQLLLIGKLQQEGKSLDEIAEQFQSLGDTALRQQALGEGSALDYIKSVLGEAPSALHEVSASMAAPSVPTPPTQSTTSTWERFEVAPGIELHVRSPISRERRRAIATYIDLARKELEGNT